MTVFLNSHILSEVESVCDRVAIVDRGRVVRYGPLEELLREALEVELFLGAYDDALIGQIAEFGAIESREAGPPQHHPRANGQPRHRSARWSTRSRALAWRFTASHLIGGRWKMSSSVRSKAVPSRR